MPPRWYSVQFSSFSSPDMLGQLVKMSRMPLPKSPPGCWLAERVEGKGVGRRCGGEHWRGAGKKLKVFLQEEVGEPVAGTAAGTTIGVLDASDVVLPCPGPRTT
jgi:hypothetical protein